MLLKKREKIPTEGVHQRHQFHLLLPGCCKGVDYECIVDPVLDDYYMGDAMKLQQVLINIPEQCHQSLRRREAKVTFSASQRRKDEKRCTSLRFIVKNDTGVGMNEEFLPHLFEPFSQESHRDHLPVWRDRAGNFSPYPKEHCGYDGRQNHGPAPLKESVQSLQWMSSWGITRRRKAQA